MNPPNSKLIKRVFLVVILMLATAGTYGLIYSFSLLPPLTRSQRNAVRRGMDKAEVLKICGQPDKNTPVTTNYWNYVSVFSMDFFQIQFDENGKVTTTILGD
jgi:hypothetical protein